MFIIVFQLAPRMRTRLPFGRACDLRHICLQRTHAPVELVRLMAAQVGVRNQPTFRGLGAWQILRSQCLNSTQATFCLVHLHLAPFPKPTLRVNHQGPAYGLLHLPTIQETKKKHKPW